MKPEKVSGNWTLERPLIFLGCNWEAIELLTEHEIDCNVLLPVTSIIPTRLDEMIRLGEQGVRILLDSGVYVVGMREAQRRNVPLQNVLSKEPSEIQGYAKLYSRYKETMVALKDYIWAGIEIDFGSIETRYELRRQMKEEFGFNPVPVWHPATDPVDYMERLASEYDMVAVGNVVNANQTMRVRILNQIHEIKERYPGTWIHVLGMDVNPAIVSFDIDSCDMSSWLSNSKWGTKITLAGVEAFGRAPEEYISRRGDRESRQRGMLNEMVDYYHYGRVWRTVIEERGDDAKSNN